MKLKPTGVSMYINGQQNLPTSADPESEQIVVVSPQQRGEWIFFLNEVGGPHWGHSESTQ